MFVRRVFDNTALAAAALVVGTIFFSVYSRLPQGAAKGILTSLGDLWTGMHPNSLKAVDQAVQTYAPGFISNPIFETLLHTPVLILAAVVGLAAYLLGMRRRALYLAVIIASVSLVGFDLFGREHSLLLTPLNELWTNFWPQGGEAQLDLSSDFAQDFNGGVFGLPTLLLVGLAGLSLALLSKLVRHFYRSRSREHDGIESEKASEAAVPVAAEKRSEKSELATALSEMRGSFTKVALFSGVINILMLTGSFFMLQVYDRVLPSRSVPTLVALALLTAGLFLTLALLDMIRSRMLVRIGMSLDESLSARIYGLVMRLPLRVGHKSDGLQPLRDMDAVRSFLSSSGPTALFDLPWMPLYLAIIYAFHPLLGITALLGAIVLVVLTLATDLLAHQPMRDASQVGLMRHGLAEAGRRNSEVLTVLGMVGRFTGRWEAANRRFMESHRRASDVTASFGSVTKALRMLLQSAVLGLGAYLVIIHEATSGIIIASTILTARALAPIDIAIANWKGFIGARQSWHRLKGILGALPEETEPMALPAPSKTLALNHATVVPPGGKKPVLRDIDFKLEAGQGLGVIGPSASGKSSLARMMVGAWHPIQGKICLDNAALDQWSPEALGRYIGYMPQDVELFAGTIAENISRFDPDAEAETIIKAAQAANVHDLILDLPNGYDTEIGEQGEILSAGQRQRVALARALYGDPFLVVLDEPNSNLDSDGEVALTQAIVGVRKRGGIVVVVAHRPSAVAGVDLILIMAHGQIVKFGPKEKILSELRAAKAASANPPLTVVPAGGIGS